MTCFDVRVGDLEDPKFSWDGGGYIPRGIEPAFPLARASRGCAGNVLAEVAFGTWAARVEENAPGFRGRP